MKFSRNHKDVIVNRIWLDKQGYTKGGRYYGVGAPVYSIEVFSWCSGNEYVNNQEFRAANIREAKEKVMKML